MASECAGEVLKGPWGEGVVGPWGEKIWEWLVLGVCDRTIVRGFFKFAPRSQSRAREEPPREPPWEAPC